MKMGFSNNGDDKAREKPIFYASDQKGISNEM